MIGGLINSGTINFGGYTNIYTSFQNNGTINLTHGITYLETSGTNNGTIHVSCTGGISGSGSITGNPVVYDDLVIALRFVYFGLRTPHWNAIAAEQDGRFSFRSLLLDADEYPNQDGDANE